MYKINRRLTYMGGECYCVLLLSCIPFVARSKVSELVRGLRRKMSFPSRVDDVRLGVQLPRPGAS